MNKILTESLRLRSPFAENYTLITETKIKSGYFDMQTKTKIRWALRVIEVNEEGNAVIELFTLENLMVETNTENLNDIITLNQVFGRMYSELHVVVNLHGEVLKILNIEHIKNKWQETKTQLLKIQEQDPALLQLLTINDEIFANPDKIKTAIENNEFFNHFFGKVYGNRLPISRKAMSQKNVLHTADAEWEYTFSQSSDFDTIHLKDIEIKYKGEATTHQNDWKAKAYGHLPDIDIKKLDPKLTERGIYQCDFKTGKLDFAVIEYSEFAVTDIIEGSIKYTLESDTYKNRDTKSQKPSTGYTRFNVLD